ncbi:hypothetical protein [uncultured Limosilactobacillus sp.]|uniref:hypothetical protein n=1 Tax=uncultured Limosilactobacillus sp. TaxID=2837629 RepID=UPI0025E450F5|nr:hypothetical protein [uncultured Limosilactobacillus sp.]
MISKTTANSINGRIGFLIISIIINSFFNALTVSTQMGSAIWTASAVSLSHWTQISLGNILFLEGVIVAFTNLALLGRFDWFRLVRNLLFITPFSYLLAGFETMFVKLGVPDFSLSWRIILDIGGLFGVAAAVSLYQRANIIMHPNDDFPYILRFRFMHGSPVYSQWMSNVPPLIIVILVFVIKGHWYSFGFGTIYNILTQGYLIGWSDRHFLPILHHHLEFKN